MKKTQPGKHQKLTSVLGYRRSTNLQPAIPDKDYWPASLYHQSIGTLWHVQGVLKSLQVSEIHAAELAKSTTDQNPSPYSLWRRQLTASNHSKVAVKVWKAIHYKSLLVGLSFHQRILGVPLACNGRSNVSNRPADLETSKHGRFVSVIDSLQIFH